MEARGEMAGGKREELVQMIAGQFSHETPFFSTFILENINIRTAWLERPAGQPLILPIQHTLIELNLTSSRDCEIR
jgi:predicted nuclease of restriction endonuclease-like (RecB) superfamily